MSGWTTPGGTAPSDEGSSTPTWSSGPAQWGPGSTPLPVAGGYWRAIKGLANALRVLLIISAVLSVVVLITTLGLRSALEEVEDDASFSNTNDAVDAYGAFIGSLTIDFLLYVAILVLFIVWMFRVAKNNEALGRAGPSFGPGWAIGGWFIPFGSLVIPALQMQELWKGTDPSVPRGDPGWKRTPQLPLIWLWWVAFAAGQLLTIIGFNMIGDTAGNSDNVLTVQELVRDLDDVRTGVTLIVVGSILAIVAAITCIPAVLRMTRRQTSTVATLGLAPLGSYGGAWAPGPPGATTTPQPVASAPAAWHPDPTGRFDHRYWDGTEWTEHVSRGGVQQTDPL
jgi:Domain of unknown function (DUF4328)/Protein of unknown function (DUF2510)